MARTLPEAVAQVRIDLGPDAVILDTKRVTVGGLFGILGRPMIQVVAASDPPPSAPRPQPVSQTDRLPKQQPIDSVEPTPAAVEQAAAIFPSFESQPASPPLQPASPPLQPAMPAPQPDLVQVTSEMAQVRTVMADLLDRLALPMEVEKLPPELRALHARLSQRGVPSDLALQLVGRVRQRLSDEQQAVAVARDLLAKELGKVQTVGFGRRVVTLVGPTGVGKTTTLAKLAAHFTLGRRMRVGLITADTFRIAAVQQLKTYSEIIGVPLYVVHEPEEAKAALASFADHDLVLVDTPGRSPLNVGHMAELKTYVDAFTPDEVYLVMSLTSGHPEAMRVVEQYVPLGAHRLLFTKWDEVQAPGLIYSIARTAKLPLSYVTTGQTVPDDFEKASPAKIANAIVGE